MLHRIIAFFTSLLLLTPGLFPTQKALLPQTEGLESTDKGRAIQLADSYYAQYVRPGFRFLNMYPYSTQSATCWEAIGLLSLSARMVQLDPAYETQLCQAEKVIQQFRRVIDGEFAGYVVKWTPFRFMATNNGVAYDDNMWLARDFAALYELTGEERYLNWAKEIGDYLIAEAYVDLPDKIFTDAGMPAPSGPVGGFYWDERHGAVHTCSTGPAAQCLAALYNITGEEIYLEYAKKCYRMLAYLENDKGTFHDLMRFNKDDQNNILGFKEHDLAVHTYNSGSPITAAVELYKATEDSSYLDDARHWAACADEQFCKATDTPGLYAYPNTRTWFQLILINGYTALLPYEPAVAEYIAHFRSGFDHSYETFRSAGYGGVYENLLPRDMLGGFPDNDDYQHTALDASSAAELYALLHLTAAQ